MTLGVSGLQPIARPDAGASCVSPSSKAATVLPPTPNKGQTPISPRFYRARKNMDGARTPPLTRHSATPDRAAPSGLLQWCCCCRVPADGPSSARGPPPARLRVLRAARAGGGSKPTEQANRQVPRWPSGHWPHKRRLLRRRNKTRLRTMRSLAGGPGRSSSQSVQVKLPPGKGPAAAARGQEGLLFLPR